MIVTGTNTASVKMTQTLAVFVHTLSQIPNKSLFHSGVLQVQRHLQTVKMIDLNMENKLNRELFNLVDKVDPLFWDSKKSKLIFDVIKSTK